MRKTPWATVLVVAAFFFAPPLRAQTPTADVGSYDWSVNAKPNLVSKPPPKQVIQAFLTKLYDNDPAWTGGYKPYGSFAFADLRRSGTLSLVAALAPPVFGPCGQTVIIDKVGEKFESALIRCEGSPIEISGKTVVVVDEYGPSSAAGMCVALFPLIYGWNGSAYVEMSKQFPGYYRKVLQDLQHEIASLPAKIVNYEKDHLIGADDALSPLFCDKIEADEIERYLGISPDAGIEDAIRWSQSGNKIDRIEAVNMFSSIGTPRALDYLKAMTEDSDPEVARLAEYGLTPTHSVGDLRKVHLGPHS